uniref:Uncharacterized protein n=1 Tax=Globodera rostochiensis TaxID=31243 RepID=A0A914GZ25_GLORO
MVNPRHLGLDGIGTLAICRVCTCRQHTVECVPRREGEQFQLRMVQLPSWAESLSMFNLTFVAFPHFATAPRLRQLRLRHCSIRAPFHPLAFVPLHSLESVHLTDNRLMNGDKALPPALFLPLTQLRELSLSGNGLRSVRIELGNQILDRLDLSQNPLCPEKKLGDALGAQLPPARRLQLEKANVLGLNSTHWTFGETKISQRHNWTKMKECHLPIPDTHWEALEQLRLGENAAFKLHQSALPRLTPLRHLDLSSAESVPEELFLVWTGHPEVQWRHICLRRAKIEPAIAPLYYEPYESIKKNGNKRHNQWTMCPTRLEWLDISELGLEGTLRLDGCGQLKWLYADENALEAVRIGDSGPAELLLVSARGNRLRHWPEGMSRSARSLTSVQLANNSISRLPPGLLEQYTQLNSLDLSQNALRHFRPILSGDDARDVSHTRLIFLNLSRNQLRSIELPTKILSSLTVLDLSNNILTNGNAGVRLSIKAEHSMLTRLDMADCSLTKMSDLSGLVALRELNLRANRLEEVPGHWLPPRSVNVLDVESNALRELGWDWRAEQLDALRQLYAMENPWECACAFVPPLGRLFTKANQSTQCQRQDSQRWRRQSLHALLLHKVQGTDVQCLRAEDQWTIAHTAAHHAHSSPQNNDDSVQNPLGLFVLPLVLIAGAFVGAALMARGARALEEKWRLRGNSRNSLFAYQLVQPPTAEAI